MRRPNIFLTAMVVLAVISGVTVFFDQETKTDIQARYTIDVNGEMWFLATVPVRENYEILPEVGSKGLYPYDIDKLTKIRLHPFVSWVEGQCKGGINEESVQWEASSGVDGNTRKRVDRAWIGFDATANECGGPKEMTEWAGR